MSITLVLVGNQNRPACQEDIDDMKATLAKAKKDKETSIVTHHAVEIITIEPEEKDTVFYFVGDDERPAGPEDLEELKKEIEAAKVENRPIVTHHSVSVSFGVL
jgi:hypothetical protein